VRRREFKSLGDGLRKVARTIGGRDLEVQSRVASMWSRVAGSEIARHTHVTGMRSGELLVSVDSAPWATELTAMGTHLTDKLNEALGEIVVRGVRFTVSSAVEKSAADGERETQTRRRYGGPLVDPQPLTDEERTRLEALFSDVADERLRETALRAAIRDLEWKKGVNRARGA